MEEAMLKVVALSLALSFWQSTSVAQAIETGSLQGAVRDENGKAVTGAAVKIRNVERGITVTVFSRGGNYGAPELFPGKSELSAGMGGHAESAKAAAEIAPGKKTLLNLALKRSAPILTPADWIAQLPDDRDGVKQLIINRCVNCHGPVNFVSRRFDRLGWKKVVLDMGRIEEIGPPNYKSISDEEALAAKSEEAERITAYLTKHFGPDKAPGLNVPKAAAYRNTAGEPDVVITQFDIPTRTAIPHNLTVDPRGHIWFVERYGEKIGGLDPKTRGVQGVPDSRQGGALARDRRRHQGVRLVEREPRQSSWAPGFQDRRDEAHPAAAGALESPHLVPRERRADLDDADPRQPHRQFRPPHGELQKVRDSDEGVAALRDRGRLPQPSVVLRVHRRQDRQARPRDGCDHGICAADALLGPAPAGTRQERQRMVHAVQHEQD